VLQWQSPTSPRILERLQRGEGGLGSGIGRGASTAAGLAMGVGSVASAVDTGPDSASLETSAAVGTTAGPAMASTVVTMGQTRLLGDLGRRYGGKPGDGLDDGHGTGLGLLGDLDRGYGYGPSDSLGDLGHGYDDLSLGTLMRGASMVMPSASGIGGDEVRCRACYGVVVTCLSLLLFCVLVGTVGIIKACAATGLIVAFFGFVVAFIGEPTTWLRVPRRCCEPGRRGGSWWRRRRSTCRRRSRMSAPAASPGDAARSALCGRWCRAPRRRRQLDTAWSTSKRRSPGLRCLGIKFLAAVTQQSTLAAA
jgi:hypothetical protein